MEIKNKNSNNNKQFTTIRFISITPLCKEILVQENNTLQLYSYLTFTQSNNYSIPCYLKNLKILQTQTHPHLSKIHKIFYSSQNPDISILSDYYNNNLEQKIANKKNSFFKEVIISDWFAQICLGIKHLHDQNIIHRFLNPKIIYFSGNNKIKVGGFGNMKFLQSEKAKAITSLGEDLYTPPEILLDKPYSFKADIWSLGVILFYLMTLKLPFTLIDLHRIISVKKTNKDAIHKALPKHYTSNIKKLVEQMLEGDPYKRPTIDEVLLHEPIKKTLNKFINENRENIIYCQNILNKKDKSILTNHNLQSHQNIQNIQSNQKIQHIQSIENNRSYQNIQINQRIKSVKSTQNGIEEYSDLNDKVIFAPEFLNLKKSLQIGQQIFKEENDNFFQIFQPKSEKETKKDNNNNNQKENEPSETIEQYVQMERNDLIAEQFTSPNNFSEFEMRRKEIEDSLGENGIKDMYSIMKKFYFNEENQRKPTINISDRNSQIENELKLKNYSNRECILFLQKADEMEKLILEENKYINEKD